MCIRDRDYCSVVKERLWFSGEGALPFGEWMPANLSLIHILGVRQVVDVDVVADAGAVRRVVIRSEDFDVFLFPGERCLLYTSRCV